MSWVAIVIQTVIIVGLGVAGFSFVAYFLTFCKLSKKEKELATRFSSFATTKTHAERCD